MKRLLVSALAAAALGGCDAETMNAISQGLAQGMAEAQYSSSYGYGSPYGSTYGGYGYNPYTPGGFSSGYWPVPNYGYGSWVGRYGCRTTGSFYSCDSNGDGYIDMWGDTSDGSYSSQYSRVNGRGEGFSWDRNCSCWVRDRSLDGPYKGPRDGKYRNRDRYDGDDRYGDNDRWDD